MPLLRCLFFLLLCPLVGFAQNERFEVVPAKEDGLLNILDTKTGKTLLKHGANNVWYVGYCVAYRYGYDPNQYGDDNFEGDTYVAPYTPPAGVKEGVGLILPSGKNTGVLYRNAQTTMCQQLPMYAQLMNGKVIVLDENGKQVVKEQFEGINPNHSDFVMLQRASGWGVMSEPGEWLLNPQYNQILMLEGGEDDGWDEVKGRPLAMIEQNEQYGVVDLKTGQQVLPTIYDQIHWGSSYQDIVVTKGTKVGVLSKKDFSVIIPTAYAAINIVAGGYYQATQNGIDWGLLKDNQIEIPMQYSSLSPLRFEGLWEVEKDSKKGVFSLTLGRETVQPKFGYLDDDMGDNTYIRVYKEINDTSYYGMIDAENGKEMLPCEYTSMTDYSAPKGHYRMEKNKRWGLMDSNFMWVLPCEYNQLEMAWGSEDSLYYRKGSEAGYYLYRTGQFLAMPKTETIFTKKWSTYIGQTSYRHNILADKGQIYVGSNGKDRNLDDDPDDALVVLNAKSGQVVRKLYPDPAGDSDVNGVALQDGKVYFGTDNNRFYCYTTTGQKLWEYATENNVEGCPALADLNADGKTDVVFAVENLGITALDGATGRELWKLHDPESDRGFMGSPAVYDITGDGTADVFIGGQGKPDDDIWANVYGNYFWAIDGRIGKILWTAPTYSKIHGSPLVLTQPGTPPTIVFNECYGATHFLNTNGELMYYYSGAIGTFSTPTIGPDYRSYFVGNAWWRSQEDGVEYVRMDTTKYNTDREGDRSLENQSQNSSISGFSTTSTGFAADVLGTGQLQVGYLTEDGLLLLLDLDGRVLHRLPLPAGGEASITVADADGDGLLELLIADYDGNLTCYGTRSRGQVWWGSFRGSSANTGVLTRP